MALQYSSLLLNSFKERGQIFQLGECEAGEVVLEVIATGL